MNLLEPLKPTDFFDEKKLNKLPIKNQQNILITSALPYVNNVPHLGNIIGSVLSGDVFSRYCRIQGYQSLYICGTDEYGTATEMKALKEGVTPKEICDKYFKLHKEIYNWFNIDFDYFGRTTTENQTEIAQDIFLKVKENGFTSTSSLEQLSCENCDKFLADRFVFGNCPHCKFEDARGDQCDGCGKLLDAVDLINPRCCLCQKTPVLKKSEHLFLDLDRLTTDVKSYFDKVTNKKDNNWSPNAISIVQSWFKTGLEKRCITRDLKWGTPVPLKDFASKVFYVWFDAPIGYLSMTKSFLGDEWIKWWKNPDEIKLYQFLGKDNVAFHGVLFPATQIATGENYTKVSHICATEYLNYEDQKFSKSRGIGVFGDDVMNLGIPADVWRFYLIYMRPETQDTVFSWNDFLLKINSELLSNLGNLILRGLLFIYKFFDAKQPDIELEKVDEELINSINSELEAFTNELNNIKFREALKKVLTVSRLGNQYMQANKPWELIKGSDAEKKRSGTVVALISNIVILLSIMLYPFMPETSQEIRKQCNLKNCIRLPKKLLQFLNPGHTINQPLPLFTKIETSQIEDWKKKFGLKSELTISNGLSTKKQKNKDFDIEQKEFINSEKANGEDLSESFAELFINYPHLLESHKKNNELLKQVEQQFQLTNKEMPETNLINEKTAKNNEVMTKPTKQKKTKETADEKNNTIEDNEIDVGKLDFRVGRILEAKKHPDADSLYVETIDVGEEKPRTVVSGLVRFVPLEQMQNRLVVCLCNLKPAKMRGIESQAMVMCASTPDKVEILEVDPNCRPGDRVSCEKYPLRPLPVLNPKKKIWETVAPDLKISNNGTVYYKNEELKVNGLYSLSAPTLRNVPVK